MTENEAIHPPADRLSAYALGRLDGPEMDEIEQHLISCDSCCRAIRDQPEDLLVARLRGRGAITVEAVVPDEGPAPGPQPGFQVPSSFVISPANPGSPRDRPTVASPSADLPTEMPAPAGLPKELDDHPRYRVVAALGAGGMGAVYRAEHRLMDRPVALKVIRGDLLGNEATVERFRREVKVAARLAPHPNIVAAYDAEQAGGTNFLVMEYIEGTDLAQVVDRRGPLPVGEACEYARQAALGLQHAFEDEMVHRDIKPQNLMRTTRGQVKILDFGLARFASEVVSQAGLTSEGMVLGSADYIAPEQIDDAHAADIRADIYSLGCTLYFLLAGRPPFPDGSLIQKLLSHKERAPRGLTEVRADVPSELARVVERMMAKDPARRFQSPGEVARALAPLADAEAVRSAATRPDAPAGTDVANMLSAPARRRDSSAPEARRRADASTLEATSPSLKETVKDGQLVPWKALPGPRPRSPWRAIAAALVLLVGAGSVALITFRIRTETGELVIESDDPGIEVIVMQGGKQVTIVESKGRNRIVLNAGRYELQLPGESGGLRLSTDTFTLKRGDKTVVSVRREPPATTATTATPGPASDLLTGVGTAEIGEIARFQSPHDLLNWSFLHPDGRHVVYSSGGDLQDDRWLDGDDPALWFGDLADPKNPLKYTAYGPGTPSLALSRDGRLALTGGGDKTLRLWDVETGKLRRVRREVDVIGHVAFSPDERHAAYVCGNTIRLCDLKTGDEAMVFRGHTRRIGAFAFCQDGRRLVSGGITDHTIRVWEVETGREIHQMSHRDGVMKIAILPDDRRVLTASWDRTIGVWDLETEQQLRRLPGIANRYGASLAISPDGRRALFGVDKLIRLWDLETNEEIERFEGHTNGVWHVAFSPDGRRAVSASIDKTVRVWALPPGRPQGEQPPVVEAAQFLYDGWSIAAYAAVSPDGRQVLAGHGDAMRLWDRESRRLVRRFEGIRGETMCLAFSPDGRRALSGGEDKKIRLWDLDSGELVRTLEGHSEWVFGVAFSPDGRLAYSTSGGPDPWKDGSDSAVRIWDLATGLEVARLEGHTGRVFGLAVSPDGRRILTGGDTRLILWDADSHQVIRPLEGHTGVIKGVAFLPDGRHAVSGSLDRTIRLWDVESGREIHCFRGHTAEVTWVAVSPDGRRLLSSDYNGHDVRLWDVQSRKQVHRINWGSHFPTRGSFTPDGRHAVWGGSDGIVRMYRLPATNSDATKSATSSHRPDPPT